jgi:hypothetical protein
MNKPEAGVAQIEFTRRFDDGNVNAGGEKRPGFLARRYDDCADAG